MSFHALIPECLRTSLGGTAIPCASPLEPPLRAAGSWTEAGPVRPSPRQPLAQRSCRSGCGFTCAALYLLHTIPPALSCRSVTLRLATRIWSPREAGRQADRSDRLSKRRTRLGDQKVRSRSLASGRALQLSGTLVHCFWCAPPSSVCFWKAWPVICNGRTPARRRLRGVRPRTHRPKNRQLSAFFGIGAGALTAVVDGTRGANGVKPPLRSGQTRRGTKRENRRR